MMRAGHGLILVVITLLTIGVVMVTSAGLRVGTEKAVLLEDVLLGRTTLLALVAMVFLFVGSYVPVNRTFFEARGRHSPIPWIVLITLLLLVAVHMPGIGHEVNGARRWIHLGIFGFQPSEVAKWGLVISVAWYAARRAKVMGEFISGFALPIACVLVICALIASEDLGTAVLIGAVSVCMLIAAGSKWWHAAMWAPVGAIGIAGAILTSEYRLNRVKAFLDPYQDPQGIGYHILQSMGAISGGGIAGRGLGNSIQKFGYLPEDTTDFIFAIICEEMGVVGAAIVIILYAALLIFGFSIVRRVQQPFQRLIGVGVLLTVGLQALMNIAVVTGSVPTKGIALPLLSSGGTGWVLTAFCIGLLVSMDRELAREHGEEMEPTLDVNEHESDQNETGKQVVLNPAIP